MTKITKAVLFDLVNNFNIAAKLALKLNHNPSSATYSLYNGKSLLTVGKGIEVYNFIQGMITFNSIIGGNQVTVGKSNDNKIVEYLNTAGIRHKMTITLKKQCVDMYFSQCTRRFVITILGLNGNLLTYQAVADTITPSGLPSGGSTFTSSVMTVDCTPYTKLEQLESLLLYIAHNVDKEQLSKMANEYKYGGRVFRDYGSDTLVWLDAEDMRSLGWSNGGMLTTKVRVQSTNY